jgi:serine/threonine-protein kinase PRP4
LINEKKNLISLTDFGTVLSISECNIGKTPYIGSRYYRSPEIALGIDIDYKSDLWSAACTIFELYTGNILFPSTSNNHMILLHMELKGLINNKLMKRSDFIENYFDSENNFLVDEIDSVSEKKIFRKVLVKKKQDIKSLLNISNVDETNAEYKTLHCLADLLEKCLIIDPLKRMDVEEALVHPFFEK